MQQDAGCPLIAALVPGLAKALADARDLSERDDQPQGQLLDEHSRRDYKVLGQRGSQAALYY